CRVECGAGSSVVARRFWCRVECGAASRLGRIECGAASLLVPPRVWSWRGYLALQSPRTPHSMCPAAVGPRRGGATSWWGPVAAGLATSRRAGAGLTAPGRAGAQPAWLRRAWLRRAWLRSGRPGSCETVLPHLSEQRSDLRVPCGVALQELATQHGGAHQRVGRETLPGGLARTGHGRFEDLAFGGAQPGHHAQAIQLDGGDGLRVDAVAVDQAQHLDDGVGRELGDDPARRR